MRLFHESKFITFDYFWGILTTVCHGKIRVSPIFQEVNFYNRLILSEFQITLSWKTVYTFRGRPDRPPVKKHALCGMKENPKIIRTFEVQKIREKFGASEADSMIPQETVQTILDTAQIVDVVSDFVSLKRRGANWVACCPFHNEKTPSFYVSPSKGIYKCFGCGKAGSAVGFVMEHEHCSYNEALRYLAKKYHIEIQEEELTPEETMRRQRNESLLLVSEFAQKFFAEQLQSGEGKDVGLAYYKSRALEDETIARFGLGWAPSGKDSLLQAARKAGYKDEYLLDAGLAVQKEDGTLTDKFRERVMFPIHSVSGRVIAFSGRTLRSDNPAKYVNSPDTPIYTKSNILFGIWFAKSEIAKMDKCIVVEGNVDLVMLHQLGIRNVVAPCGTSFTEQQIRLIRKFTDNVTLMFDGDGAGIHAALRAIDMILKEGMNVSVVRLPAEDDPDSFARKHTLEEYQNYLKEHEQDFLAFKSEILLADAGNDPLKRANLINDIADTIALIPDQVKASVFVNAAAQQFDVDSEVIFTRVRKTRAKLLEDWRKEKEREAKQQERREREADYEPVPDYGDLPKEEEAPVAYQPENKALATVEEQILKFLLVDGLEPLEFPFDTPEAREFQTEQVTVTEFISDFLDLHGFRMENQAYARVYDAYLAGYDAGFSQEEIIRRLLNSPDRVVAGLAASISTEKYTLSIEELRNSLTIKSSWLTTYVPKTMLTYIVTRNDQKAKQLRKALGNPEALKAEGSSEEEVMKQIMSLQEETRRIKKKLSDNNE